ncbi:hypothetical protein C8Q73DRAFT_704480 [Cubamyces lactineus]|nr:hypothetical protein C8Q73DRAFT_704480 [Cubamyces lactineus]
MTRDESFSPSSITPPATLEFPRSHAPNGQAAGGRLNKSCTCSKAHSMQGPHVDELKSCSESPSSHNAALPVNSLPTEMLMTIFYHARRILLDIRFSHVCRRWREVIFAMPEFWLSTLRVLPTRHLSPYQGNIQHAEPPSNGCDPLLEQILSFSAPLMIHARLTRVCDIERRAYGPHIDRIAEMTVEYNDQESTPVFMKMVRQGLPNLKTLHYFPMSWPWGGRPLPLDTWPAGTDAFFPNLHRLDTAPSLLNRLSPSLMQSLQHLTLRGCIIGNHTCDLAAELKRCPSLISLTLQRAVPDSWVRTRGVEARLQLLHLQRLSIEDDRSQIRGVLHRAVLSPAVHLTLDIGAYREDDLMPVFSGSTILRSHILPSLSRLYLGYVHAKGRIRMLGFTQNGQEQLDVARWYDFAAVLAHIAQPFADSGATVLAIHLPHLPITLERASWDQDGSVPCPIHLCRLELLGGTPLKLKQRFTRWFLRSCGRDGRPTSDERTLCWVFNVERGREQQSREDLWGLEAVLAEHPDQKLGTLELYGTTLSGQIFTNVSRVATNPVRCAEVVEAHLARLSNLVSQVLIV